MNKFFNIFIGVVFVLFGIYLWNHPLATLAGYSLYLGLFSVVGSLVALGFYLFKKIKPVPYGQIALSFLSGVIIMAMPVMSLTIMLWMFIFGFLGFAIYSFVLLLEDKSDKHKIFYIALSVLAIIYGLVMLFNPIAGFNTMAKILAFFVIVNGVSYFLPAKK